MATQIVADGQYNAFLGLARNLDGSRVLTYRKGTTHAADNGTAVCRIAASQGAAYGAESTILAVGGQDVRDPEVTEVATPAGLVLMCSSFVYFGGSHQPNALRLMQSTDGGVTWTGPTTPTDGWTDAVACSAKIVQLPDGDLLWPCYGYDTAAPYMVEILRSSNYGNTWTPIRPWTSPIAGGLQEPNIVLLENGDLLMLMRSGTGEQVYESISTDNGQTWSTPVSVLALTGRPHCRALPDGTVIVMARNGQAANSEPMMAIRSADGVWGGKTQLIPGETDRYTYASSVIDEDGNCEYCVSIEPSGTVADIWTGVIPVPSTQRVTSSTPAAGTQVSPGSMVILNMTAGDPVVQNYFGDSLTRAQMRVTGAGLIPG